jgi:hypothetical protein
VLGSGPLRRLSARLVQSTVIIMATFELWRWRFPYGRRGRAETVQGMLREQETLYPTATGSGKSTRPPWAGTASTIRAFFEGSLCGSIPDYSWRPGGAGCCMPHRSPGSSSNSNNNNLTWQQQQQPECPLNVGCQLRPSQHPWLTLGWGHSHGEP